MTSVIMRLWKSGNKATCYRVKSFNPIDVLMERDGLSFIDAVSVNNNKRTVAFWCVNYDIGCRKLWR